MQTRAGRRRAQQQAVVAQQPRLCLSSLPAPAQHAVMRLLEQGDKHSLRLASKGTASLVHEHTQQLRLPFNDLCEWGAAELQQKFPSVCHLIVEGDDEGRTDYAYNGLTASECEAYEDDRCVCGDISSSSDGNSSGSSSSSSSEEEDEEWGGSAMHAAKHMQRQRPNRRVAALQPWDSISILQLCGVSLDEAALAAGGCPSARLFQLERAYTTPDGARMASLCAKLASLPNLTTVCLKVSYQRLYDNDLAALNGCSRLAALEARLGNGCGAAGMRALLSIASLQRLELEHRTLEDSVALDFAALTALQELCFLPTSGVDRERYSGAFASLQLPSSLRNVQISYLPLNAVAGLSHLASLEVAGPMDFSARELGRLATACPMLDTLHISSLHLTQQCHKSPLLHIVRLIISGNEREDYSSGKLSAAKGARLANVFPAVEYLRAPCDFRKVVDGPGVALFAGLTCMEELQLDLVRNWDDPAWHGDPPNDHIWDAACVPMKAEDFMALAALPQLGHLELPATSEHVVSVGQLAALTSIEWCFNEEILESDGCRAQSNDLSGPLLWQALEESALPCGLRCLSVKFERHAASCMLAQYYTKTVDAAMGWLGRAISAGQLEEVVWSARIPDGAAGHTWPQVIQMAAASDAVIEVQLMPIFTDSSEEMRQAWVANLQQVDAKHQREGLAVFYDFEKD